MRIVSETWFQKQKSLTHLKVPWCVCDSEDFTIFINSVKRFYTPGPSHGVEMKMAFSILRKAKTSKILEISFHKIFFFTKSIAKKNLKIYLEL
jgi:hypothetical protein